MLSLKRAGELLKQYDIHAPEAAEAVTTIQAWRKTFLSPMQTIYVALRKAAKEVDVSSNTARRLKKLRSIQHKLRRNSEMRLPTMQDIGGCRAVVTSVSQVRELSEKMQSKRAKRELTKLDDYIESPKESGYRSLHLIFLQPVGKNGVTEKKKIEVQIRTNLQHTWATAVELAEMATNFKLKAGEGTEDWKRFFALVSSVFALQEGTPPVPGTPETKAQIIKELKGINDKHKIIDQLTVLRLFRRALDDVPQMQGLKKEEHRHYILYINSEKQEFLTQPYSNYEQAYRDYMEREKLENGIDSVVLVSVESYSSLQAMYPNYFADIGEFLNILHNLLGTS